MKIFLSLLPLGALALASAFAWLPRQLVALYCTASVIVFLLYMMDKAAARNGRWRVRESTLHLWSLACGWPGAIAAQQIIRHKTSKPGFTLLSWLCAAINCAGLYAVRAHLG